MQIYDALLKRKSVRAFLNKEVKKEKIIQILEGARHTASSTNMQPWSVHIVSKNTKKRIDKKTIEAFDKGIQPHTDYPYYPDVWIEPYSNRRKEVGIGIYKILDIKREDKEKRKFHWRRNYCSFGSPITIYIFMDSYLKNCSFVDNGMFIQSILLMATELGLGSCPMGSLAEYPDIVRQELDIKKDKILICGIALGYEDKFAPINSFKPNRLSVKEFTKFYE